MAVSNFAFISLFAFLLWNVSDTPYQVMADTIRLKQVFVNLLSNAVKYNKEQGTICLQCEPIDQNVL